MTSNDKYFSVLLIGVVAIFAAVGYELVKPEAAAPQEIVKLERVVIVGKRAEPQAVAQLPRVVIVGRRAAHVDDTQVAVAKPTSKLS